MTDTALDIATAALDETWMTTNMGRAAAVLDALNEKYVLVPRDGDLPLAASDRALIEAEQRARILTIVDDELRKWDDSPGVHNEHRWTAVMHLRRRIIDGEESDE